MSLFSFHVPIHDLTNALLLSLLPCVIFPLLYLPSSVSKRPSRLGATAQHRDGGGSVSPRTVDQLELLFLFSFLCILTAKSSKLHSQYELLRLFL